MTTEAQTLGEAIVALPITTTERSKTSSRLLYVDNMRTFLTILVLLHHIMIVYAASGSWPYTEGRQDLVTTIVGNIFCTINQAYFMGLFLLISAYFVPGSNDRKGTARFWKDRLVRLGIPLVIYSWLVHPLFYYWFLRVTEGLRTPLWDFYPEYFSYGYLIGVGPLWFVETLLILTLFYAVWRQVARPRPVEQLHQASFPSNRTLALFALSMALASFVVRLKFPMDWNFKPMNLQLPYFAQYVAMFIAGLVAYRHSWLEKIPARTARFWLRVTGVVLLMYVPGALLGGALESDQPFKGGWHWQTAFYDLWEAYLCVGMCIGLLYLFHCYTNQQGRLTAFLSRSAYAAYIVQVPVITGVALLFRDMPYHPLLKFVLVALVAVPLCFGIAALLRRLPYADRVV
jgi:glucan biosynthesis protein C